MVVDGRNGVVGLTGFSCKKTAFAQATESGRSKCVVV